MNDTLSELQEVAREIDQAIFPFGESHASSANLSNWADRLQAIIDKLQAQAADPVASVEQETFGRGEVMWLKSIPKDGTLLYLDPQPSAPAVPEGWQLVPKEPTAEMIEAYNKTGSIRCGGFEDQVRVEYQAMLQAAPQAQDTEVKK